METLYLLGAGASANAIPVVGNFQQRLYDYINAIHEDKSKNTSPLSRIPDTILKDLIDLHNGILFSGTPDIYAKSLFLQNKKSKYKAVKSALSFFLTLLQINEEPYKTIDPRYLGFFSALLDKDENLGIKLHKDIKIANWNYDLQIPLSLSELLEMDLSRVHHHIGEVYNSNISSSTNPGKFFRLNGYAGSYFTKTEINGLYLEDIFSEKLDSHDKVIKLIEIFDELSGIATPFLNFAWDSDPIIIQERKKFFESLQNVKVIVVLGYSFPTFNRFIDKDLFQSCSNLEKVYVQDTNPDIVQRVKGVIQKTKLKEIGKIEIQHVSDIGQFFIPPELDQ